MKIDIMFLVNHFWKIGGFHFLNKKKDKEVSDERVYDAKTQTYSDYNWQGNFFKRLGF